MSIVSRIFVRYLSINLVSMCNLLLRQLADIVSGIVQVLWIRRFPILKLIELLLVIFEVVQVHSDRGSILASGEPSIFSLLQLSLIPTLFHFLFGVTSESIKSVDPLLLILLVLIRKSWRLGFLYAHNGIVLDCRLVLFDLRRFEFFWVFWIHGFGCRLRLGFWSWIRIHTSP